MSTSQDPSQATSHFKWGEFYCPTAGHLLLSDLTTFHVEKLEELRTKLEMPLRVNSGYRSPEHNTEVGGAPNSMHLQFATDICPYIPIVTMDILDFINELAEDLGFSGIGRYNTFVHLDCREFIGRDQARWDNRK